MRDLVDTDEWLNLLVVSIYKQVFRYEIFQQIPLTSNI